MFTVCAAVAVYYFERLDCVTDNFIWNHIGGLAVAIQYNQRSLANFLIVVYHIFVFSVYRLFCSFVFYLLLMVVVFFYFRSLPRFVRNNIQMAAINKVARIGPRSLGRSFQNGLPGMSNLATVDHPSAIGIRPCMDLD